ncbi:MAG: PQQ-dependent sugar dehydrogenase [Thermoanaerobaculia bacterium]
MFGLRLLVLLFASASAALHGVIVPGGFADSLVTSAASPTAIAFTPDGRLLIATQPGVLHVFDGTAKTTALDLGLSGVNVVCTEIERGLVGLAVDPSFTANSFIYLYYTRNKFADCSANVATSPVNRVSRFTLGSAASGSVVNPASELVLVDNIPSPSGYHNGGDLHFGLDGLLYISVGDGGCQLTNPSFCQGSNANARRLDILSGKILRVGSDGSIPAANPKAAAAGARRCGDPAGVPPGTGPCQEMFAWGLRNPFRFAFRPGTNSFYIDEVGGNVWEEINASLAGADYGWNVREGPCVNGSSTSCGTPPVGMTNPIYAYRHGDQVPGTLTSGCGSITGGAFVPAGIWPSAFEGSYLFSDYVCGSIFRLLPTSPPSAVDFIRGLGSSSAVAMIFGPHLATQSLYYTSYAGGGEVRRIDYTGSANRAPTAVGSAYPSSGALPLIVTFDASGSSDADQHALVYLWSFDDGSPDASTASPTLQHTYTTAGIKNAVLRARDSLNALSAPVTVTVFPGNSAPVPLIASPLPDALFTVGEPVTLTGSAQDAEDGALADARLSWTLLRHHGTHTHPFLGPVTGNHIAFIAPAPEDIEATATSYVEIRLTATDSSGLAATRVQSFYPRKTSVTFDSVPSCLRIVVNDESFRTPFSILSWAGYPLFVSASDQSDAVARPFAFSSWSDGGGAAHEIVTPPSALSVVATFQATAAQTPVRYYSTTPCRAVDTRLAQPLLAGVSQTFVLSGTCGIPSDAAAVAGNVTVVSPSGAGQLSIIPAGFCLTSASTLSLDAGRTRGNNALLTLGVSRGVEVVLAQEAPGEGDLLIDVVGYFK